MRRQLGVETSLDRSISSRRQLGVRWRRGLARCQVVCGGRRSPEAGKDDKCKQAVHCGFRSANSPDSDYLRSTFEGNLSQNKWRHPSR